MSEIHRARTFDRQNALIIRDFKRKTKINLANACQDVGKFFLKVHFYTKKSGAAAPDFLIYGWILLPLLDERQVVEVFAL